ncbi:fibrinogen-related protein 3-2 [Plakobranchus ocellatus]|uniref:Fibrinogen-related protein 3-2 n=1 Tax=Plakobranchus ocellatus TaxID=259542 RepID=A0AAV3Y326_9GAST|nr:fibrinogen-related protein 3-2 [Plakobranchus ocellatus]
MKSELFSTVTLILLCFNACCEGLQFALNRDIQVTVGSRISCGILLCEEKLPPKNISSSFILNMTVFKNQPSCSRTSENKSETRVVLASINSDHPNISRITDATNAFGAQGRRDARLRIEMFRHDDCRSDFICEVQGLDSQKRVFLSTTKLLQQQGDEILAGSLREVKDKIHSLENRIEDKIDAKLSAIKKDDTHCGNEADLNKKLLKLRRELSDEQQNGVTIILDYIDARLFSNQVQVINKLRDLISAEISPIHNTLKDILNTQGSSQRKAQSTLSVINSQLSRMRKPMMTYIQPLICKRGMTRPSTSYPYPHPLIYPRDESGQGLPYLCDIFTDGGGWIVIQRRSTGKIDFYRDWETYKKGFGTFDDEFWLGNERMHAFTRSGTWELRVDLKYKGKEAYALYSHFKVESESKQYTLRIGSYSGNAGDSLDYHKGQKFSTYDRDNDSDDRQDCAEFHEGGWWYNSCDYANLNGRMNGRLDYGLEWNGFAKRDTCSFSEMKMRRVA